MGLREKRARRSRRVDRPWPAGRAVRHSPPPRKCALFSSRRRHVWPLLLFVLVSPTTDASCEYHRCGAEFSRALNSGKVLLSSNLPYCFLLEQYEQCLRGTSRSCRGDLRFHSINTMVANHRKEYKCSSLLERHRKVVAEASNIALNTEEQSQASSGQCLYPYHHQRGASGYRYCSVFGDPHIRTLNGQHETCRALGAWPLLDNSYFAVQITNSPLGEASGVSHISKVTVVVKTLTGCTEQKMYEATREFLPSSFVDGTSSSDQPVVPLFDVSSEQQSWPRSSSDAPAASLLHLTGSSSQLAAGHRPAVVIRQLVAKEHVEIYIRYISTRITVRLAGGYLSFSVKIPEEIVAQKSIDNVLQLCLTGCPSSERVEYKELLADPDYYLSTIGIAQPTMRRAEAELICREAGASDFFFDSCVFDLLVTGDEKIKMSSVLALRDIRQLYPTYVRNYEMNRTNLQPYDMLAKIERSKEMLNIVQDRRRSGGSFPNSARPQFGMVIGNCLLVITLLLVNVTLVQRWS